MSTIDASSTLSMQDLFSTTLSGMISATDTVIGLNAVPTASEGFLVLELGTATEYIYYNSKTSNTVTCPSVARGRGQGGTTAVGHTTGASVKQVVNADFWKELQNGNANLGMQTYFNENFTAFVATGCVWTGDALGSTKAASMTAGTVYVAGKRLVVAAVTARTFTASKDTYIDVTTTTGSNAGTVVYTEVTNNAASPALAANSMRIGIIVTGATTIAAAGSINQGDPTSVLPIASSIAYSVTDSLGNLICNRNPNPTVIGYRQSLIDQTGVGADTMLTGLNNCPVIIPTGRKIKITGTINTLKGATGGGNVLTVRNGTTTAAAQVGINNTNTANGTRYKFIAITYLTISGSQTYGMSYQSAASNADVANSVDTGFISVELV